MNCKWLLVCVVATFFAYETAGQSIHCYSCYTNLGSRYGTRNYNCANNLTTARTIRCSRGYYCLTSFTVEEGIVTYIRRSCQNPRSDHYQNSDDPPTEDGCISTHSRYSATSSTCYRHCTTTRCNDFSPSSIKRCPEACPNNCNLVTGTCISTLSCVQCTSESDEKCETKTNATACPTSSYNYCAATRTTVINLSQQVVSNAVTKTCTSFSYSYNVPTQPCVFRYSTRRNQNRFAKYTCSSFCAGDGCNMKIPGGTSFKFTSSALSCVVCSQVGTSGSCARSTRRTRCPSGTTHCKATVTYYQSPVEDSSGNPTYLLSTVNRECATEAVERQCTAVEVADSNLQHVTCQETCQTSGCNNGWPARPKCSICDATNRTYSTRQFNNCRTNPFQPSRCSSPLFQYCTTISNNTASDASVSRRVRRGCSITDIGTRCYDITSTGGNTINHCQTSCKSTGCNQKPVL